MNRTIYKTKQEVIDAIKAMREFPRYAGRTHETAEDIVCLAARCVSEQYPGGWGWDTVARVAKYMVRKNDGVSRAILAV